MIKLKHYKNKAQLVDLIEGYFIQALSISKNKQDQPPTVTGMALHLGFKTKEEFDLYEIKGKFATIIKQAHFRIMAYYESRLHYPAPTGAIFALKNLGWHEKNKPAAVPRRVRSIKVKVIETGPRPAATEKDVTL